MATLTATSQISSLYGLNTHNCCNKDFSSEKIVNTLLPIAYLCYAKDNNCDIPLYNGSNVSMLNPLLCDGFCVDTEKVHSHSQFIQAPPNDICITNNTKTFSEFYESKVVLYKGEKTELILRQDCFAFNCIQHILLNNSEKKYTNIDDLIADRDIVEKPYLLMTMWKKNDLGIINFDCIVFTDKSIMQMIRNAETSRSKESVKLMNTSLVQFSTHGKMTYKETKSDTVPHQKVSLFPLRDIPELKSYSFSFNVKSTNIILNDVRSDTNLWQEIEKSRLIERIKYLERENIRITSLLNGVSQ
jgi:hypothetical protein